MRLFATFGLIVGVGGLACGYVTDENASGVAWPGDPNAAPHLELVDEVTVGGYRSDPGHELAGVRFGALLPSGGFAISTNAQREVRVFDREGDLTRVLGREGSGPGEFSSILGMAASASGQIAVWDLQLLRVSYFDDRGDLLGTASPERAGFGTSFVGIASDSIVVLRNTPSDMGKRGNAEGVTRDSIEYFGVIPSGDSWSIVTVLGPERYFYNRHDNAGGSGWGTVDFVFGRTLLATTRGEDLVLASSDSGAVTVLDAHDVRSVRRWEVTAPRAPMTSEMVAAERSRRIEEAVHQTIPIHAPGLSIADLQRSVIRDLPVAAHLPVMADLLPAGTDGYWVREFSTEADAPQVWHRLDDELSARGWVELEPSADLLAADERRLLVLTKDSLDVETVTLRAIQ